MVGGPAVFVIPGDLSRGIDAVGKGIDAQGVVERGVAAVAV